jgi:hypothetical protein
LHQRLVRDVDEQRFRALQIGLRPLRPATPLHVPFDRLDAEAMADSGVGEQAGKRIELRKARREHVARGFHHLLLLESMRRDRGRK